MFWRNLDKSSVLFLLFCSLIALLVLWASTFKLDRGTTVFGTIGPLGHPIVIQSRFDGKVSAVHKGSGDQVQKGDKIVSLETDIDGSDLEELRANYVSQIVTIERYKAQKLRNNNLDSNFIFKKLDNLDLDLGNLENIIIEQRQALSSELNSLNSQLKMVESERAVKESEIRVFISSLSGIKTKQEIAEKRFKLVKNLFENGFEGEIAFMEASSELVLIDNELVATETELNLARKELELIDDKIESIASDFDRDLIQRQNETKELLRTTEIRMKSTRAKLNEFVFVSPSDGFISSMKVDNPGQVFSAGDTIAEIITDGTPLVFFAKLPVQFIADIHLGQDAKVTPSTFDTRTLRSLNGKVTHIEPDATTPENEEPYYLVTVSFDGEEFSSRIKPGVDGTGALLFGKRTVMQYYFEPLISVFRGALSEG